MGIHTHFHAVISSNYMKAMTKKKVFIFLPVFFFFFSPNENSFKINGQYVGRSGAVTNKKISVDINIK